MPKSPSRRRRLSFLGLLVGLPLALPACASHVDRMETLPAIDDAAIDRRQLRFRVSLLALFLVDEVERTAETIEREYPAYRDEALEWKISASNAVVADALQADPVVGLIGAWALSTQMRRFFSEGPGSDTFGPAQEEVLATCRRLEQEAQAIASTLRVGGEIADIEAQIASWSVQFPFEDLLFSRRNTGGSLAQLLADSDLDVFSEVRKIEDHADYLISSLPVLLPITTKQARWQAELVLGEAMPPGLLPEAAEELASLSASLEEVAAVVADLPETLARERELAFTGLDEQRVLLFHDLEIQRECLLEAWREERAVLEALTEVQRTEILTDLDRQRQETLAAITAEREVMLSELSALLDRTIEDARGIVDETWWRTMLAGLAGGAVLLLGAYLAGLDLVRRLRRR